MKNSEQRRAAIAHEYGELAMYRGQPAIAQLVALLDALVEDTLSDLASISPESLRYKQGALAQLKALHGAITNPGAHASPKA
jgi:hypothetical protein